MSKIDELIANYCPDGIERKPLGTFAELYRGNGLQKKDFTDNGVGCIHYGQIYTRYGTSTTKTISFVDEALAVKLLKVHPNDLIVTATSENLEDVCKTVAWLGESDIVTGGHSIVVRHQQNAKYLSYYFQTRDFFQAKRAYVHGTKVMEIKKDDLAKIEIPVPPLPVQEEIVRILDSYSAIEAELERKLAEELEARRKQYAHYRDQLLNFVNLENSERERVQWLKLADVARVGGGHTPSKFVESNYKNGSVPWITSKDVKMSHLSTTGILISESAASALTVYPKDSIAVVLRSGILKRYFPVAMLDVPMTVNQDIKVVTIKDGVALLPRFLYHCIDNYGPTLLAISHRVGGTVDSIPLDDFKAIPVPMISVEEQRRIASILDRFDKLTNDLTSGLPAEIKARRKQYEYYRDRLLSFDELAA